MKPLKEGCRVPKDSEAKHWITTSENTSQTVFLRQFRQSCTLFKVKFTRSEKKQQKSVSGNGFQKICVVAWSPGSHLHLSRQSVINVIRVKNSGEKSQLKCRVLILSSDSGSSRRTQVSTDTSLRSEEEKKRCFRLVEQEKFFFFLQINCNHTVVLLNSRFWLVRMGWLINWLFSLQCQS